MAKRESKIRKVAWLLIIVALAFRTSAGTAAQIEKGSLLPDLALPEPALPAETAYLGIESRSFHLNEVSSQILLVEIVGVYCPRGHEQAPLLNNLYMQLEKHELKHTIKMLAIAAGATPMEVEMIRKQWHSKYPIIPDERFKAHKLLGEPRTPLALVVDKKGRVLHIHEGAIKDIDAFYQLLKEMAVQ